MLDPQRPTLILAPMEGVTDAPMRALQGATGAFTFAVSEFVRVSSEPVPAKVFHRAVPELRNGGSTSTGMPVQVQILGGDPERMALSAVAATEAGAKAIDINFGCPAKTVNRNDGGASLLKEPSRIREVVAAVRAAVAREVPVSAKLRLGWDSVDSVRENAAMAAEGGASWLTIHARTRVQGYAPPVDWPAVGRVRAAIDLPVVANGDVWSLEDFRRCRVETGCRHFMIGRGALADPSLPLRIAGELGIADGQGSESSDWPALLRSLVAFTDGFDVSYAASTLMRMKQWLKLAHLHGAFPFFEAVKRAESVEELLSGLDAAW